MEHGYFKSPVGLSVSPSTTTNFIRVLAAVLTVVIGACLVLVFSQIAELRHLHNGAAIALIVGGSSMSVIWIAYSRVVVECLNTLFGAVGLEPDVDKNTGLRLAEARHDELDRARRQMRCGR